MICNTRGHSVSCKMQRKSCKSHVFFFSRRHPMRKIKPPYILPARTRTWSSSHFYSLYIKLFVILRWSDWHPLPSPPFKHFKGFPSSAICPSRVRNGGHFYHSMRVLFSWAQLGPAHEITIWAGKDPAGTYDRCDRRRLRRACVFAPSRQGLAH